MRTHPYIGLMTADLLQLARFWLCNSIKVNNRMYNRAQKNDEIYHRFIFKYVVNPIIPSCCSCCTFDYRRMPILVELAVSYGNQVST